MIKLYVFCLEKQFQTLHTLSDKKRFFINILSSDITINNKDCQILIFSHQAKLNILLI